MDSSHESDQSAPPLAPNLTGEVCVVGRIPLASGGYSIVYKGEWRGSSGPARPVRSCSFLHRLRAEEWLLLGCR